jgi:ABC-type transport system involved in multi-copper enzyme maturation permease subunit
MRGVFADTTAELLHRKLLYVIGGITLLTMLGILGLSSFEFRIETSSIGVSDINRALDNPLLSVLNTYMYVLVFIAVMATAGIVPGMLVSGRAEYYLSKPISRRSLLLSKIASIWILYGAAVAASTLLCFLATVISFGFYDFAIVYVVLINLIGLFVWLTITVTAGVITGSTALSILAAFLFWIAQKVMSVREVAKRIADSDTFDFIADTIYYILPKTTEMSGMGVELANGRVNSWLPLYSTLIVSFILMGLAIVVFERKDY